jgi:hypothetical protein
VPNSKQKPAPEGTKRSPGKSKFSIPRKEAPLIDGSYLDRLFADYEKQTREVEGGSSEAAQAEGLPHPVAEHQAPEISKETAAISPVVEAPYPATTPRPVPFTVEDQVPAQREEPSIPAPQSEAQTHVESAPFTEKPASQPPAPALEAPVDDDELVQKLVRLHRLSKGEASILRVMIRLCQERDSDICYIKIPQLMAITGLKDRQTQRVLKSLSELRLIERLAEYSNADRLGIKYRVIPFHG